MLRYRIKNAVAGEDPSRRWPPAKRELALVSRARSPTIDRAQAMERAAQALVMAARKQGVSDEQIEDELARRGLKWPGRNLSPGT